MQKRQFEDLFKGEEAVKYLTQIDHPQEFRNLSELLKGSKNSENIEMANDIMENNSVEMPQELSSEIRHFIDRQRKLKIKERTIRRMVKRKFGIMIVPK